MNIGFIGLGLIGGSILKSLKIKHPDFHTIASSRSIGPLQAAVSDGMLDEIADGINDSFSQCDYIFLCTPVEYNSIYLGKLKDIIKPECIITDVGSVKGYIHKTVTELGMESSFIGGHPMAGSEKTGYAHSNPLILENAYYAITPTCKTKQEKLAEYENLVKDMGAIPVIIDPDKHDYSVAGISHLPHIIASSLVNIVKHSDSSDGTMKMLAAGGFKDITRIASSSPEMWQQICLTNTSAISSILGDYIESLKAVKEYIDTADKEMLYSMFEESRDYRNSVADHAKGVLQPVYGIYVDVADEEGAIALITSILALRHVSIKNISLVHNREFEQAVLSIEFYKPEEKENAISALKKHGYTIYDR